MGIRENNVNMSATGLHTVTRSQMGNRKTKENCSAFSFFEGERGGWSGRGREGGTECLLVFLASFHALWKVHPCPFTLVVFIGVFVG